LNCIFFYQELEAKMEEARQKGVEDDTADKRAIAAQASGHVNPF
jgi:hypothetical protein